MRLTVAETHNVLVNLAAASAKTTLRSIGSILFIIFMALELYIPPCISSSAHPLHPPPLEQPLRIQIEGPLASIQKLLPEVSWHTDTASLVFPQPAGPGLARLAYQKIYGQEVRLEVAGDMVVRDEYLGWVTGETPPLRQAH